MSLLRFFVLSARNLNYAARRNEPGIGAATNGAIDAIGPAQLDHGAQRHVRVAEIPDGLNESVGLRERFGLHKRECRAPRLLSQVYCYPK